jgi:hypothetical protein
MLRVELGNLPSPPVRARRRFWRIQLDLQVAEVARLYGAGLARGALVWNDARGSWTPLVKARELEPLLRNVRIVPGPPVPVPPRVARVAAPAPESSGFRIAEVLLAAALSALLAWLVMALGSQHVEPRRPGVAQSAAVNAPRSLALTAPEPARSSRAGDVRSSAGDRVQRDADLPTLSLHELPAAPLPATAAAPFEPNAASASAARAALRGAAQLARHDGEVAWQAARDTTLAGERPGHDELVTAMNRVRAAASSCGERQGPVRVTITFGNSGASRSVQVSATDESPELRACLRRAASRARVRAFSGEPLRVTKTL